MLHTLLDIFHRYAGSVVIPYRSEVVEQASIPTTRGLDLESIKESFGAHNVMVVPEMNYVKSCKDNMGWPYRRPTNLPSLSL
jgi:hypothetical protein